MTLFHQNSPQLQNQLKAFPVRLNDVQLLNISQSDNDYFLDYDETLDGISIVAFLPIIVIGILLAVLIFFFKFKSLRSNRGQLDRLEEIYQVLETVDQIAADPYATNAKLVDEIRYALILDDGEAGYFHPPRRDSLYPQGEPTDMRNHRNHYHIQIAGMQNELLHLNDDEEEHELESSQIV